MSGEDASGAVVVVGAAGGLGGAILRRLVEDRPHAPAWITYRSNEAVAEAAAASVPNGRALRCDLHDRDDITNLADAVRQQGQGVSALVHAAVEIVTGPALEIGYETFSAVVESSGLALLALTSAFDEMLLAGSSVLYVTSIGSYRVIPTYSAVGTAKACGESLVRYLAVELADRGVRVNAISPGPFVSEAAADVVGDLDALVAATDAATPRGRHLDLEEIADVAGYLCDQRSSGVTGQVVTLDAGLFTTWRL